MLSSQILKLFENYNLVFSLLCIKVGRGQGDGDVGRRVWGLGTWGHETRDLGTRDEGLGDARRGTWRRETRDLRTSSMVREDVKNRDAGDAGCE